MAIHSINQQRARKDQDINQSFTEYNTRDKYMQLSDNDIHWINKTTDLLLSGKLKVKPEMGNKTSIISMFDHMTTKNLKEGISETARAGYEKNMKRKILHNMVEEAYVKMQPMFHSYVLKGNWEKVWNDFVVTQLYL